MDDIKITYGNYANEYKKKHYDNINILVKKGTRDKWKKYAEDKDRDA